MTQTLGWVAVFVFFLALLPMGVKWLKQRALGSVAGASSAAKIVSVLAVGPHQRVVTVEQGPDHARVRLTLGVTAQTITLLHSTDLSAEPQASAVVALPDPGQV